MSPSIFIFLALRALFCGLFSRLFALDQMPELTIHTGGNASFDDTFYSIGWPSTFSPPSSPSGVNSNETKLRQAVAAAATAAERLSAACCTTRPTGLSYGTSSALQCVEGYSFFDPEKAWLALTCGSTAGQRRVRATSASAVYFDRMTPSAGVVGTEIQQLPLHHSQPYTASECYRLVQDRQASADSVASYETFAPKKPQSSQMAPAQPHEIPGAAAPGREPSECGRSSSSGDSPLPPMGMMGARDQKVGLVFAPGSTLLLPPVKGVQHASAAPGPIGTHALPAGATAQKTHCVSTATTAAAREAYIMAAAKRISEKAQMEAAFGAATNAAHQAQLKKLQDVAPQASDLAQIVIQQQQTAAQQQNGQQAAVLQRGPLNTGAGSISKPKKVPIYDANPVPIYEATAD